MPSVTKVIFACDESGAKGYSDQNESYDGEVGVFAGLLLDSAQLDRILPDFKTIYDHYAPVEGKFHIADLPPDRQEALRQDVYTAVTKHQLPCFWYAVLNRPGFTGEYFVQNLSYFIKGIQVCIEVLLCFFWCYISDRAVQAFCVVPVHPFQGFPFNLAHGFPRAKEVNDFGFE